MCMNDQGPPKWSKVVNDKAEELIAQWTAAEETITSLSFKVALRAMIGPDEDIIQADSTKFLRQWYLNNGGKDNYDIVDNHKYMTYTPKLSTLQKAADLGRELVNKAKSAIGHSGSSVAVPADGDDT